MEEKKSKRTRVAISEDKVKKSRTKKNEETPTEEKPKKPRSSKKSLIIVDEGTDKYTILRDVYGYSDNSVIEIQKNGTNPDDIIHNLGKLTQLANKPNSIKINRLIHISDIHIRDNDRFAEYRQVFNRLYEKLREIKDNFLIVLTGDLIDKKDNIAVETYTFCWEFLAELSAIAPVIMISGNHDMYLNSLDRKEKLYIFNKRIPDLYYLRETGFYQYSNIIFSVSSLLDKSRIITKAELDRVKTNLKNYNDDQYVFVNLYHGLVKSDETYPDTHPLEVEQLDFFDYTLLGDIHKQKMIVPNKIGYAGSLIQQNFEEAHNEHGYLYWNLSNKTAKYINIPNQTVFWTIDHDNKEQDIEKMKTELQKHSELVGKKLRVNLRIEYSTYADNDAFNELIEEIRGFSFIESIDKIKYKFGYDKLNGDKVDTSTFTFDLKDEEIIDKVFEGRSSIEVRADMKKRQIPITPEIVSSVKKYHNLITAEVNNPFESKTWKIIGCKFKNCLIYKNNVMYNINFDGLDKITGIIGDNAVGKTSLLLVLIYGLYGKVFNTDKKTIINNESNQYMVEVTIEQNSKRYVIQRVGSLKKNGAVMEDLYIFENGVEVSADKKYKDEFLENIIGDYSAFILRNVITKMNYNDILQMDYKSLVSMISKILQVDKYEDYMKVTQEKVKKLKEERNGLNTELTIIDRNIDIIKKLINKKDDYQQDLERVCDEIDDMKKTRSDLIKIIKSSSQKKEFIKLCEKLDAISDNITDELLQYFVGDFEEDLNKFKETDNYKLFTNCNTKQKRGIITSELFVKLNKIMVEIKSKSELTEEKQDELDKIIEEIGKYSQENKNMLEKIKSRQEDVKNIEKQQISYKSKIEKALDILNQTFNFDDLATVIGEENLSLEYIKQALEDGVITDEEYANITNLIGDVNNVVHQSKVEMDKEIDELDDNISQYREKTKEYEMKKIEYENEIKNAKQSIEQYNCLEYNPDCDKCTKNPLIKQGQDATKKISKLEDKLSQINEKVCSYQGKLEKAETKYKKLSKQRSETGKLENICNIKEYIDFFYQNSCTENKYRNEISDLKSKRERNKQLIEKLQEKSNVNEKIIEENDVDELKRDYNSSIMLIQEYAKVLNSLNTLCELSGVEKADLLKTNIEPDYSGELESIDRKLEKANENKISLELTLKDIYKKEEELLEMMKKYKGIEEDISNKEETMNKYYVYQYVISIDGIPKYKVEMVIPRIEEAINKMLSKYINKQIHLDSDGFYLRNEMGKMLSITASSNMESCVMNMCVKCIFNTFLIENRCNLFIIDEGWDAFSVQNEYKRENLIKELSEKVGKLIIISHIETMKKDMLSKINIKSGTISVE